MNDKEITLTLTLADANLILAALGKLPFEAVADLVAKVKSQGQAQIEQAEQKDA